MSDVRAWVERFEAEVAEWVAAAPVVGGEGQSAVPVVRAALERMCEPLGLVVLWVVEANDAVEFEVGSPRRESREDRDDVTPGREFDERPDQNPPEVDW